MKYFILQTPAEIQLVTVSGIIDGELNLQMKEYWFNFEITLCNVAKRTAIFKSI